MERPKAVNAAANTLFISAVIFCAACLFIVFSPPIRWELLGGFFGLAVSMLLTGLGLQRGYGVARDACALQFVAYVVWFTYKQSWFGVVMVMIAALPDVWRMYVRPECTVWFDQRDA